MRPQELVADPRCSGLDNSVDYQFMCENHPDWIGLSKDFLKPFFTQHASQNMSPLSAQLSHIHTEHSYL